MLGKTQLHDLYYWMLLTRILEERLVALYRTGKVVGGVYTSRGQEAISIGTAYALEKGDWLAINFANFVQRASRQEIIADGGEDRVRECVAQFLKARQVRAYARKVALLDGSGGVAERYWSTVAA